MTWSIDLCPSPDGCGLWLHDGQRRWRLVRLFVTLTAAARAMVVANTYLERIPA